MSQDQLRGAIDALRSRIQAEFDSQLTAIEQQQAQAVDDVRRSARAEADAHWTAEIDRLRAEWSSSMESALSQAAAEADRRLADGIERTRIEVEEHAGARARLDLEHALAEARVGHEEAATALKRTLDSTTQDLESSRTNTAALEAQLQALRTRLDDEQRVTREQSEAAASELRELTASRDQLRAEIDQSREQLRAEVDRSREQLQAEADRSRGELERARAAADHEKGEAEALRAQVDEIGTEVDRLRPALEAERSAAARALSDGSASQATAVTEARAAERQSQLAAIERMRDGVRNITSSRSLSDALAALAAAAASQASRAVVFVVKGQALHPTRSAGFESSEPATIGLQDSGAIPAAIAGGVSVTVTPGNAPKFAALQNDRAGLAVPITVGRQPVAVLYADNARGGDPEVPAAWPEAVEILCSQASATLAQLTALRTAQAMRLMQTGTGRSAPAAAGEALGEADQAARRYARLLISEIKLYNEGAVRVGREQRDLLTRLRDEVGRARRLYEERVPPTVTARDRYFDDELRQILADGDASRLGNSTVTS
jgi:hypothetical protein